MASLTRSNRRAEGFHQLPHSQSLPHHVLSLGGRGSVPRSKSTISLLASANGGRGGRQKRTLETVDRDIDALKPKKTRIAVEILAKHPPPVQGGSVPSSRVASTPLTNFADWPPAPGPTARPALAAPAAIVSNKPDPSLTKHQNKVINGIKHELNKLDPPASPPRAPGRKLRSQEATRFKSELSAYFPDYDEVIGNDPKEEHVLGLETPIVVVDSNPRRSGPDVFRGGARASAQNTRSVPQYPARGYGDSLYTEVFDAQRIDFSFLETQQNNKNLQDPLPDGVYEPAHKRAERLERSIRNSEKGRAQHEKDQVIRLLEGLQGHDWLRVMGVSGITESRKKSFEPARAYFIKGCLAILEKFRNWNLEEKKRKQERERALHAEQMAALAQQEEEEEEEEEEGEEGGDNDAEEEQEDEEGVEEEEEAEGGDNEGSLAQDVEMEDVQESEGDEVADSDAEDAESANDSHEQNMDDSEVVTSQSDTSDVSPAKQLQQEALARSQLLAANAKKSKASSRSTPSKASETPTQFTSFFSKKHERESALHRTRRTGRKVFAWGHAVPEIEEADFALPEEYLDGETLKARARKKRRDKRNSRP